jgi:8-oxo-dGTP pyrophosphatase MutT (NUDIX family)
VLTRIRASVVCVDNAALLCVRLRDPGTGVDRLFVPGGGIEPDERPAVAAVREAVEETGYAVEVDPHSELVARYPFVWNHLELDVTTHFFSASLCGSRAAQGDYQRDAMHLGVEWLPLGKLYSELGYDQNILRAVRIQLNLASRD